MQRHWSLPSSPQLSVVKGESGLHFVLEAATRLPLVCGLKTLARVNLTPDLRDSDEGFQNESTREQWRWLAVGVGSSGLS